MNDVFKNVVNIIDKGEAEGVYELSELPGEGLDIKLLNLIIKNIKSGFPPSYTKYILEVEILKHVSTGKLEDCEMEKMILVKSLMEDMYALEFNVILELNSIMCDNEVKDLIAMHRLTEAKATEIAKEDLIEITSTTNILELPGVVKGSDLYYELIEAQNRQKEEIIRFSIGSFYQK